MHLVVVGGVFCICLHVPPHHHRPRGGVSGARAGNLNCLLHHEGKARGSALLLQPPHGHAWHVATLRKMRDHCAAGAQRAQCCHDADTRLACTISYHCLLSRFTPATTCLLGIETAASPATPSALLTTNTPLFRPPPPPPRPHTNTHERRSGPHCNHQDTTQQQHTSQGMTNDARKQLTGRQAPCCC